MLVQQQQHQRQQHQRQQQQLGGHRLEEEYVSCSKYPIDFKKRQNFEKKLRQRRLFQYLVDLLLGAMTVSITAPTIMTLCKMSLAENDSQHNDIQHKHWVPVC